MLIIVTGLYYKLHGHHRPVAMKKAFIKRRKRVTPANAAQSTTGTSEHQSSASISPNPGYAHLPERPSNNDSQSSPFVDPNLGQAEASANQLPYPRGPPPVDFTLYSPSYNPPARPSPSSVVRDRNHGVDTGSVSRNHIRGESDLDHNEAESDDRMERHSPNGHVHKVWEVPGETSGDRVSAEDDRAAKRRRKQDLAIKMKQMQAELLELGEDSDEEEMS